jgi:hypothetical protein
MVNAPGEGADPPFEFAQGDNRQKGNGNHNGKRQTAKAKARTKAGPPPEAKDDKSGANGDKLDGDDDKSVVFRLDGGW